MQSDNALYLALLCIGFLCATLYFITKGAFQRGFFLFRAPAIDISHLFVIKNFTLFIFFYNLFISLIYIIFSRKEIKDFTVEENGWISCLGSLVTLVVLFCYSKTSAPATFKRIIGNIRHWKKHIKWGIASLIVAYSWVFFFSFVTKAIIICFQLPEGDLQHSVVFIESLEKNSYLFFSTVLSTVVFIPLIEEFLFRGVLQSYLIEKCGAIFGILITSIIFAFLHYSPQSLWSNLEIISTIFFLSIFMGFVYIKRQSLIAPFVTHMLFNSVGMYQIYQNML